MENLVYIVLGTVDVLVLLALTFKIFRWPLRSYLKELLLIGFACSIESYFSRMVLHIPQWDIVVQNLILMFLMRYMLKVNYYHALTLSMIGSLAYSEIVYFVFNILAFWGLISHDDASQTVGIGIFITQITSESVGIVVAWLLYRFNMGFSFVAVPPHDRKRKLFMSEKINLGIHFLAVICLMTTVILVTNYSVIGVNIIMALELAVLLALLFLARKEEYNS